MPWGIKMETATAQTHLDLGRSKLGNLAGVWLIDLLMQATSVSVRKILGIIPRI